MTDSISKMMGFEFLKPALHFVEPTHVVCRMAAIDPLIVQLQAHRLDIVLADEPASSTLKAKTFNHRLGRSGITFCAMPALAAKLRRKFPQSLDGAPALLPSENMGMRMALETWFDAQGIRPRVIDYFFVDGKNIANILFDTVDLDLDNIEQIIADQTSRPPPKPRARARAASARAKK